MSTESRVAALQSLLERVLTNSKLPRPWVLEPEVAELDDSEVESLDDDLEDVDELTASHQLVLDPLTEEPVLDPEPLEAEQLAQASGPEPDEHDEPAIASRPTPHAPPSVRGRPPTPPPPARLTPSDSSPLHDAVISHTETAPGAGSLENGFGLVPPPPRKPSSVPDFHDEPTATGDPDEAEDLLLAEQEAAERQRVRFPTPPPGSAVGLRPYSPDLSGIPTPPVMAHEPIRPPSPAPFPASGSRRITPPPPAYVPLPQPSRPVLELDLDLDTPSVMPAEGEAASPDLDFDRGGFSDDGVKTDPPPMSIGRAEHVARFAPTFDGHPHPSLPDIDAIEENALGTDMVRPTLSDPPESDVEERSPSSSRQLRDQVRPIDDRFDDFGPVGESEPPPESGEVPSQSHPQVGRDAAEATGEPREGEDEALRDAELRDEAQAEDELGYEDELSSHPGDTSGAYERDDYRPYRAEVDQDATAEVASLGRVDVVERTRDPVEHDVVTVLGTRPALDETFGTIVDASLALRW